MQVFSIFSIVIIFNALFTDLKLSEFLGLTIALAQKVSCVTSFHCLNTLFFMLLFNYFLEGLDFLATSLLMLFIGLGS
jgi:hypothetical protein